MQNKWLFVVVASFFNSLMVTGAFIEFRLRGVSVVELPNGNAPLFLQMHPGLLAGGMFLLTFVVILLLVGVMGMLSGISRRLQTFNQGLRNVQASA
jgi:hypothetical protein